MTSPLLGGVGAGVCDGIVPGAAVGLVCCVPGAAVGFVVVGVVPGMGS